nr:probable ADP,ATP carrier protein At5g56450 [Tanacetum cinerariifolium]
MVAAAEDDDDVSKKEMIHSSYWLTNFPRDLMAGAMMGGMVHTVVAPIERTKLLLQTQESNLAILAGKHKRFNGMIDCILTTVKEEGLLSLWRGNGSSVLRYYPSVALNFSLKDLYRSILRSQQSTFLSGPSANFIAGAAAGCTTLVIIYPLDIAHTRLAADLGRNESRQFKGIRHFVTTVWAKDGFRGVYKGLPASLQEVALWKRWIVAQAVTTSAGLLSYPMDTVRRRMMMQSGTDRHMYRNTLDCWKTIYTTEGFPSFYRGALSNMFRSTGAAAVLVLYDEVKKFMNWSS